jgi:glycosyltransferase involved in cell wall biosynthesis
MIFAGQGYAEKGLRSLVSEMHMDSDVSFLGLVLDRELLKSLFARANLFLFPSLYDTSGIVIQEAAAMRCPTLVLKNANAAEGIIDCYNGFLSENDEYAYAQKIKKIILNKDMLIEVGKTARYTIYKNWETVLEEVKERYIDIINTYKLIQKPFSS